MANTRNSGLLNMALTLVRLPVEEGKPYEQRLPEFTDANIKAMKGRIVGPLPYDKEREVLNFTYGLQEALDELGAAHPLVQMLLGGKSPAEAARAAVEGSHLSDPAVRKALLEGGAKAVADSKDPMVVLARRLDPMSRKVRKQMTDEVDAVVSEHGSRIALARFGAYGKDAYPDATFSLRLTYGPVSSYQANGTHIQPFTTFHGLYDRAAGWGPEAMNGSWALPQRWLDRKGSLKLDTPYNFSHSVDIIGGNSGSAVVDTKGELVGLIFDGNIESLPGRYFYDEKVNRGVSVDARAILEALSRVYDAHSLVTEISGN